MGACIYWVQTWLWKELYSFKGFLPPVVFQLTMQKGIWHRLKSFQDFQLDSNNSDADCKSEPFQVLEKTVIFHFSSQSEKLHSTF